MNLNEIQEYMNTNFNYKILALNKIIWNVYSCFNPKAKYKNFNENFYKIQILNFKNLELLYYVTLNTSLIQGNTASNISFLVYGRFVAYTTNRKYTKLDNIILNFIL